MPGGGTMPLRRIADSAVCAVTDNEEGKGATYILVAVTARTAGNRPVLTHDVSVVAVGFVEMPVGVAVRPHTHIR